MNRKKTGRRFFINFVNGIVLLLPIFVTVGLVRYLILQVNSIILDPIMRLFSPIGGSVLRTYAAKTLIFFIVIFAVALIGWGAKILMVNRIFSLGEKLMLKIPFMGKIYSVAKQIFSAFIGQGKTIFKQVVLLEYPRKGLYSIGFTTGTAKGEIRESIGGSGVTVFIPTTPNPTSGIFIVIPRENLTFLKMSVEEGMKLVVSGGSLIPPFKNVTEK